jgi:CheY-like chemotaxis protein
MHPPTILLVEDNPENREIYGTFLRHFGYRVLEAMDGAEGVRMARESLPRLVLMDVGLPVLDGLEATRRLKADPATAAIPVVALTAHAMDRDRDAARDAGCDAYVSKPAEPTRVLAIVRTFLDAEPLPAV